MELLTDQCAEIGITLERRLPVQINGEAVRIFGIECPRGQETEEAAVKRAMIGSANYVVVAADSSKVGREDFISFAPLSSVDALITDSELSGAYRNQLTEQGIEVVVA